MKENVIKKVMRLSVVAALYVALTFAFQMVAYGGVQFRVAEILVLLCFFRKDYSISMIIGCLIVNIFSPLGFLDIIFGTIATMLSVFFIMYSKKLFIACLYPVLFNGIIIGLLLTFVYQTPFMLNLISVGLGEIMVMIFGYLVFNKLGKDQKFIMLIDTNKK